MPRRKVLFLLLMPAALCVPVVWMAQHWGYRAFSLPTWSIGASGLTESAHHGQYQTMKQTEDASDFKQLAGILERKLLESPTEKSILTKVTCDKIDSRAKPCANTMCPEKFSPVPSVRLKEILATRNSSLQRFKTVLSKAAAIVGASYQYVFVTAVSSSHYNEMQALVLNLHKSLFPRLSNFTFVIFDIGLTPAQRRLTEKNCKCLVLDYPFNKLPSYFSQLRCYTWKPSIIWSLIEKTEYLVWMDSSVRWTPNASLGRLFTRSRERGLQLGISRTGSVGVRTYHEMFQFYGDKPCQYEVYGEVWATYGIYHNEPFVRQAILDPWLSCAFSRHCMCLKDDEAKTVRSAQNRGQRTGLVHRFDQSSLGIIVSKLFGNRTNLVSLPYSMNIGMERGETADWFVA